MKEVSKVNLGRVVEQDSGEWKGMVALPASENKGTPKTLLRFMSRGRGQSQVCPELLLWSLPYSHLLCALRTKVSVYHLGRQRWDF